MYLVSACLLGTNCKYNGENNRCQEVIDLLKRHQYISVCPEVAGGLSTPRSPAEIREGRVYSRDGTDLTEMFRTGAEAALKEGINAANDAGEQLEMAVLKARSPSCGAGTIYDGTFTGVRIAGDGLFTRLLKENGIKVITEEDVL